MKRFAAIILLVVALVGGCRRLATAGQVPRPRIVSFSPAITQMLFDMGLGGHVVGVTSQDALPAATTRPVVGDAFSVNAEAILSVRPDVLMIQMNPDRFEALRRLDPNIRIEHFTIETLDEAAAAMERIGRIAGDEQAGRDAAASFRAKLEAVRTSVRGRPRPKVLFITDLQTLGTAGEGTFIDQMIDLAGGINVARKYKGWVMLTAEGILLAGPEVIICQAEAGREEKAAAYWRNLKDTPAVQKGAVHVVTDRRWTIPSAALADFAAALAGMIHPELAGSTRP
jgi:iron complex transport system substrate-binding protein